MLRKLFTPSTNTVCYFSFFQAWVKETQFSQLRFCCGHHILRSSEVDQNVLRIIKTSMESKEILKENEMRDYSGGLEQSIEKTLTNNLLDIKWGLLYKDFHIETNICKPKTAGITRIDRMYDGMKTDFSRIKQGYVLFEQNSICYKRSKDMVFVGGRNQRSNHRRENINGLSNKISDDINKKSKISSFRTKIIKKDKSSKGSKIGNACDTALIAEPIDSRTKSTKHLAEDIYKLTLKSGNYEMKYIADKENVNVTKRNPVILDGRNEHKPKAYTVNVKCKANYSKNIRNGKVQRAIDSSVNRSADSSKDMDDGKDINNVEEDLELPEEPTTCCMSGCANCVWIEYAEKLNEVFSDESEKTKRIILEKIKDPNMKAFLQMELDALVKKNQEEKC